jgi:tetratricopeptide (TPR) repeat protein
MSKRKKKDKEKKAKPKAKAKAPKPSFDAAAFRERLEPIGTDDDVRCGPRWTAEELAAFEREHKLSLPAEYRSYLIEIGDGGPGFVRIQPLEGRSEEELSRAGKVFRVTNTSRVFPLKETALFGTLELGPTDDGVIAYLVVGGARAGEVWVDGTPADGSFAREGMFGELMTQWLDAMAAEASEDRAIHTVAALGDQGAERVAGEANTRGLQPAAVARQILADERAADSPNPAACEAAAAIFETAGETLRAATCFALAGHWTEVRRIATAAALESHEQMMAATRPGDSGAIAIDVATHLTHVMLAAAALGETATVPCEFPVAARYDLVDTQTIARVVARLPDEAARAFYASVDPTIGLGIFTRSDPTTWGARVGQLVPALQRLALDLAAGRSSVPDATEASSALAEALVHVHGDPDVLGPVLHHLARCCALLGVVKDASACWQRCRALGWKIPDVTPSLAELLRHERDGVLLLNVAAALMGAERYSEAADLCAHVIAAGSGEWMYLAHYNRGTARSALGDHARAIEDFDKTIELRPDYAWAYNNRANAYYQLGDLARARESSRKSLKLDPNNGPAYWALANICAAEDDRMGFFENIEKAMRLGAKVWERLDRIHSRFAGDRELEALIAKYRS